MFRENRIGGSTPTMWANNFVGRQTPWAKLSVMKIATDLRWREIEARVKPGARVLDAGFGAGEWVRFLAMRGYDAVGVDYSESLVKMTSSQHPELTWLQGDIRAMPVEAESVDAVVSWGVIEHDENGPSAALKEFFRVLKPGGWIFVTVPLDTPEHRASSEQQFGAQRAAGDFFQYLFTPDELISRVREAGFHVDMVKFASHHYALLYPDLYLRVVRSPRIVQFVAARALHAYASRRYETRNMVLAVAQKP